MIDYVESKIARREYEERVQSLTPIRDYDVELTHSAGHWQARPVGGLLAAMARHLSSLGTRLNHKPDVALDSPLVGQEQGSVPG